MKGYGTHPIFQRCYSIVLPEAFSVIIRERELEKDFEGVNWSKSAWILPQWKVGGASTGGNHGGGVN